VNVLTRSAALWYASRAAGIVTLVLLSLVAVLGVVVSRKVKVPGLPRFAVVGLHRSVSLLAVIFLTVHVLSAVADKYVSISPVAVVLPFTSAYRPLQICLGAVALDLGLAVVVTSLLRARIGWRLWRGVHWLAYAAYPIAFVHGFTSADDMRSGGLLVVSAGCVLAVACAIGYWLKHPAAGHRLTRPASAMAARSGAGHVPGDVGGRGADRQDRDRVLID
jgi:methionine sulfoxide reductase heme-binding subunit